MLYIINPVLPLGFIVGFGWYVIGERPFYMERFSSPGEFVSVTHVTPYLEPPPHADPIPLCLVIGEPKNNVDLTPRPRVYNPNGPDKPKYYP